jgi:hypothetical protein
MNRAIVVVGVAVAFALTACSSASSTTGGAPAPVPAPVAAPTAPPPPPPTVPVPPARDTVSAVNPEGNYELQIVFGGAPLTVAMELYRENGAWRGSVGNPALGSADVTGLVQDGRKIRATFAAATGETFIFSFELKADNSVAGTWSGMGDGSQVAGRKVR